MSEQAALQISALSFFVPGVPAPKQSARFRAVRRKATGKYIAMAYRAGSQKRGNPVATWEETVALFARAVWGARAPLGCPVEVRLEFFMPPPKKARDERVAVKPDCEQLAKPVLDAISGRGAHGKRPGQPGIVLTNDSRVWHLEVYKRYRAPAVMRHGEGPALATGTNSIGVRVTMNW